MSNVFGNLGKRISTTLESAQKDFKSTLKTLSKAAGTTLDSTSKDPALQRSAGSKTQLFTTILERSRRVRDHIIDRRDPHRGAKAAVPTGTDGPAAADRDEVQEKLVVFARLEKEFCDLIEAYEILLFERVHMEEIFTGTSQLESLDDLELVGQYYKALQDTSQIYKQEIVRLTEELAALKDAQQSQTAAVNTADESINIHGNRALTPVEGGGAGAVELFPEPEKSFAADSERPLEEADAKGSLEDPSASPIATEPLSNHSTETTTGSLADSSHGAKELAQALKQELQEKNHKIRQLEDSHTVLQREKASLNARISEQNNIVSSLESQKIALETRVSYLQKQLADLEGLKGKLKEVSSSGQAELMQAREEIVHLQRRLKLVEAEHLSNQRLLEASQTELSLVREERERERLLLSTEARRLEVRAEAANQLLVEERTKSQELGEALHRTSERLDVLSKKLQEKEAELLRQQRAATTKHPIEAEHQRPSPVISEGARRSVSSSTAGAGDAAVKALRAECEMLALENSRLRATSQFEHMRNVLLRYLQLPDQRAALMPVIASLFRFTRDELATIQK